MEARGRADDDDMMAVVLLKLIVVVFVMMVVIRERAQGKRDVLNFSETKISEAVFYELNIAGGK